MRFKIILGTFEKTYELYETNAPVSYDYGYSIQVSLGDCPSKDDRRLVLIDAERKEYQLGRYGSGLYQATESDDLSESMIADIFLKRIQSTEVV